jgi:hypothetical protein
MAMEIKTKTHAKEYFKTDVNLAKALGITPQAVCQWDEVLTVARRDWINGAILRINKKNNS